MNFIWLFPRKLCVIICVLLCTFCVNESKSYEADDYKDYDDEEVSNDDEDYDKSSGDGSGDGHGDIPKIDLPDVKNSTIEPEILHENSTEIIDQKSPSSSKKSQSSFLVIAFILNIFVVL